MLKTKKLRRSFGAVAAVALSLFFTVGVGARRELPDLTVKEIKFRSNRAGVLCRGADNHFQIFIKSTTGMPDGRTVRVTTLLRQGSVLSGNRTTLEIKNAGTQKIEIGDFNIQHKGRLEVKVTVDAANELEEEDETNNTKTLTFDVQEECGQSR